MKSIKIVIHTENAAFQNGNAVAEISRILNRYVSRVSDPSLEDIETYQMNKKETVRLADINGNSVGTMVVRY